MVSCLLIYVLLNQMQFNPRLTKLLFVTRLTKGNPFPRFSEPNPYEIDFGINR